jgi:hypothetical protein
MLAARVVTVQEFGGMTDDAACGLEIDDHMVGVCPRDWVNVVRAVLSSARISLPSSSPSFRAPTRRIAMLPKLAERNSLAFSCA